MSRVLEMHLFEEGTRDCKKYDANPWQDKLQTLSKRCRLPSGVWGAQCVEHPASAQVMILRFMSLSCASGSVLTARSLEPALDSVSPSLSAPPPLTLCLSLRQK